MTKKTINNFANEDDLEGFNLQRLHIQVQGSRGNGRLSDPEALRAGGTAWNFAAPALRLRKYAGWLVIIWAFATSLGVVKAQTYYTWNSTSGTAWSTAGSWNPSGPPNNSTAVAEFGSVTNGASNQNLGITTSYSIGAISLN